MNTNHDALFRRVHQAQLELCGARDAQSALRDAKNDARKNLERASMMNARDAMCASVMHDAACDALRAADTACRVAMQHFEDASAALKEAVSR